jgi:catechol 2,3-dioxygenase-like lactoylglutathione lyase family enzyme
MPRLNVEHFACNVSDPVAMAAWYVEHLGMRVVRRVDSPQHIHFMADANGRVVIEIYNNTADPIPTMRRCTSFDSTSRSWPTIRTDQDALEAAGATFVEERRPPDGSRL